MPIHLFTHLSRKWFLIPIAVLMLLGLGTLLTQNAQARTPARAPITDVNTDSCQDQQKLQNIHFAEACYWRSFLVDENGNIPTDAGARVAAAWSSNSSAGPNIPLGGGITGVGSWTAIGPGNSGGRIRSIVIHPTISTTIWVGSVGGGVFKTTDGGATWNTNFDSMASLAVSTLVISPTNPNILYAGTGEGTYNIDAIRGAGVFKTTDGGATWNQLASTSVPGANCDWCYVNCLAISPDGTTLLAAQNINAGGQTTIWRSTNGGASWTSPLIGVNLVQFVAFDPTNSLKAVASGRNSAWYSTDGGATWNVAAFSPVLAAPGFAGRVELAYAPNSSNIVYASVDQNNGEVYKSTDGGANYTRVNTGQSLLGDQGWYDNAIWVNPLDPNFVAVGGPQFWISRNGGTSFTSAGYAVGMHPDHHAIVADPGFNNTTNRRVYVGNDGGIYRTDDISATLYPAWTSLVTNLPITQFYSGAGHNATGKISGGTQDNGSPGGNGTPAGFNSWIDWTGGDGGYIATDNTDVSGNTWYGEYVYLSISRSTTGFTPYAPDITGGGGGGCGALGDAGSNALFIAPFTLDPNNANRLLGGGDQLWLSANAKAATPCWSSIKASVGAYISAIAVKQGDSNTIWVGYDNGRVDMTTNGGGLWTQVGSGTLPGRQVSRIAIDPTDANNVFVTFGGFYDYTSGNVWRTTNAGANWTNVSAGLPAIPVFAVTFNPNNHNLIYIGTAAGVFDTQTALTTTVWSANDGPANVAVTDLSWVGGGLAPKLLAATHGRSMWITSNGITAVTLDTLTANADNSGQGLWLLEIAASAVFLLVITVSAAWYVRRRQRSQASG